MIIGIKNLKVIRIKKCYIEMILLGILIIIGELYSSELALVISLAYISYICFIRHCIPIEFNNSIITIMIIGLIVGVLELKSINRDYCRDLFKVISPICYLYYGYLLQTIFNEDYYCKTIIYSALFVALRSFSLKMFALLSSGLSFSAIRSVGGNASPVIIVAFTLLLFNKEIFSNSKKLRSIIMLFFCLSIFLYLSRTAIIMWLPSLMIYIYMNRKQRKILKALFIITLILIFMAVIMPTSLIYPLIEKFAKSFTEISHTDKKWAWAAVNNNWRGYEIYLILKQFENVSLLRMLFGYGFGKLIDLDYEIQLGDSLYTQIAIFHNGYYFILLKSGYLGLVSYVFSLVADMLYYIKLYLKKRDVNHDAIQMVLILAMATSCYVIAGIYNGAYLISICITYGFLGGRDSANNRIVWM